MSNAESKSEAVNQLTPNQKTQLDQSVTTAVVSTSDPQASSEQQVAINPTGAAEWQSSQEERINQSERIVKLVTELNGKVFLDASRTAYISFESDGHRETWPLESREAKDWVAYHLYESSGEVARNQAIEEALHILSGKARFGKETVDVHLRVAGVGDAIYLDLVDSKWRAIKITSHDWGVVLSPPVHFRRSQGMLPLPEPVRGGQLDELAGILNLGDADSKKLISGFLLETLNPKGPYPVLAVCGSQGTGKTTTAKGLRYLVDPHETTLRPAPRGEQDLVISAYTNRLLAFDNLSRVPPWLSDALCRVTTGGGFACRRLYTNGEEFSINCMNPVLINGIVPEMLLQAPDLLDRAMLVELPSIEAARNSSEAVSQKLEEARPRLLGALLDAAVCGLKNRHSISLSRDVRMMDFAMWVEACAPALGWGAESFLNAYLRSRRGAVSSLLENWQLLPHVVAVAKRHPSDFFGTVQELLHEIQTGGGLGEQGIKGIPGNAKKLSSELRRHQSALKAHGIEVTFEGRGNQGRKVRIRDLSSRPAVPIQIG